MKAIIYQEYQGQGSGKPNGVVWGVQPEGKPSSYLEAENEEDAIKEVVESLGIDAKDIEIRK